MMTEKHGGFFGIERSAWEKALALGLNPAVAYLVLARGTAADHRTTPWSVRAIEKFTGISRPRARDAVDSLFAAGLVREIPRNGPPLYDLGLGPRPASSSNEESESLDLTWLPNELVTGAVREVPPLELVRQRQEVAVLGLLIGLYAYQNLAGESGVDRKIVSQIYTREKVFERGQFVVFRFTKGNLASSRKSPLAAPFLLNRKKQEELAAGWRCFWDALVLLQKLGLVCFIGHLAESDLADAEIMFPLDPAGLPGEAEIADAASAAACELVPPHMADDPDGLVPVPAHMTEVKMVGIARLKYRARTRNVLEWAAREAKWQEIAEQFRAIGGEVVAFPAGQNGLKKTA